MIFCFLSKMSCSFIFFLQIIYILNIWILCMIFCLLLKISSFFSPKSFKFWFFKFVSWVFAVFPKWAVLYFFLIFRVKKRILFIYFCLLSDKIHKIVQFDETAKLPIWRNGIRRNGVRRNGIRRNDPDSDDLIDISWLHRYKII